MKFFLPAFITGSILNLFLFSPVSGIEINPEYFAKISAVNEYASSPASNADSGSEFFLKVKNRGFILHGNGRISHFTEVSDSLVSFSENGKFYVKYQKVGKEIQYYNISGESYWKLKSREYPYLSYNGRMIFLMNGDQSSIRIADYNGNLIGNQIITGRLCTVISFSERSDFGCIGFLGGSYYFLNQKGMVISSGSLSSGMAVKGLSISNNGQYASVHYGNTDFDFIRIVNIKEKKFSDVKLGSVHPVRTSVYTADTGDTTVIDFDRIVQFTDDGDTGFIIKTGPLRNGYTSISHNRGIYSAGFTLENGDAGMLLFRKDGVLLMSKNYPAESFMKVELSKNVLFLRGSDYIFTYSISNAYTD